MNDITRILYRKNSVINTTFVLCAIVMPIFVMTYFGVQKKGLFGDEIYTFNLANSYYAPFLADVSPYFDRWLSSDFWRNLLVVHPGTEFNYGAVFYNQSLDVHPPLYYVVIHTVCSLFPMEFSRWFGIIPNMIFFVLTQIVLLHLAKKFFTNPIFPLLVCIFYGFSWGTVNNIVYIRMYALMTLFGILSVCLHLELMKNFSYVKLALTLIVSLLGILTQYYFLIFQFFVSFGYCVYLLYRKEFKTLALYIVGYVVVLGLVFWIFPASVYQITGKVGNQGQTAFKNLEHSNLYNRINVFGHIISQDLFGGHIKWTLYALLLIGLARIMSRFCRLTISVNKATHKLIVQAIWYNTRWTWNFIIDGRLLGLTYFGFISFFYFLVTAKVAPYLVSRYLVILHPMLCIIFIYIISRIQAAFDLSNKKIMGALAILICLYAGNMYRTHNLFAFDGGFSKTIAAIHKNPDIAIIVVQSGKGSWPVIGQALRLCQVNSSYMMTEKELPKLNEILQEYNDNHQSIIIYRGDFVNMKPNDMVNYVTKTTPYKKAKEIDNHNGQFYLFTK